MKLIKKFNFKLAFAMLMLAAISMAGFGLVKKSNVYAETPSTQIEQTQNAEEPNSEGAENLVTDENNEGQVADGNWIYFCVAPGGDAENMGSVSVDGNTYYITTAAELAWVASQVNGGNTFEGKTIVLASPTGEFNMGGKFWTPIGTSSNPFKGTFNGQGNKITGLTYQSASSFFGATNGAFITDVIIGQQTIR